MSSWPAPDTRQAAEQYVSSALGDYAAEHDVPAITDALYDLAGSWDVRQVDPDRFWSVVQRHALPGQEASGPGA